YVWNLRPVSAAVATRGRMAGWMWIRCFLGPHLQRVHRSQGESRTEGRAGRRGWTYQPKSLEKHTDSILGWVSIYSALRKYSAPLNFATFYFLWHSLLLSPFPSLSGWGRWRNSEYQQFISILEETRKNHTPSNKVTLLWQQLGCVSNDTVLPIWCVMSNQYPKCHLIVFSGLFLIAHSFGRRMLYPGSVFLLQRAMRPMLQQGQARLIEECEGQRNKLVACDGNEIDTMFVDRRRDEGQHGQTLVICCEGNAGFYEVGCMNTPLEGGYSVLGWNHPGFAGSTGVPFPQNEANAMDVVIQFAVHKLGFQLSEIVVYAWSIGGFTASWAVMSYPEIQALVLDASFDDLLPLALKVMPDSWRPLVTHTVRQYMNLNSADQLCKYQGPVLLIRRTKDEIITTTGPEDIMSNRGNNLLLKLLQFRYPQVMTDDGVRAIRAWLAASNHVEEAAVYSSYEVDDDWCVSVLQSYKTERDVFFPWSVGKTARKYMRNFDSTHCTPLPYSEFTAPWRL
uniref:Abhydrolase domain containing 16A, phospholipase n=1 Tax=Oncorhynchus mykiss TaxID=8022 RepID=A0A8C7V408_ONCMY